jgi:glutathione-regulated potassium-efflux system ancillary protein KefG
MPRLLILFAHPAYDASRVHRAMAETARRLDDVTFHDLYEAYPDFDIDIGREQALLARHDRIVLQFPIYWYSTPPMVKQWEDLVLTHGWAYGQQGTALRGKHLLCAASAGARQEAYSPDGFNEVSIRQYLLPIEATARLCGMIYHEPFVIHGTHRLDADGIRAAAASYGGRLEALRDAQ